MELRRCLHRWELHWRFYTTAKKEKRKQVLALMIPAALTAMLTGITEPIEFTRVCPKCKGSRRMSDKNRSAARILQTPMFSKFRF